MKRCPSCRRDYLDDSLSYCLDDGSALLEGPSGNSPGPFSESDTQLIPNGRRDSAATAVLPANSGVLNPKPSYKPSLVITGAVAILALAVLGAGAFYIYRITNESSQGMITSIAVLPLDNLSNDPAQEYFADGMTEAIIGNLSQIDSLKIISRTSVMRYKKSGKSIPEIAKELSVDGIVEGSVQRVGDRIRVTAQLIRTATDSPIWTKTFEQQTSDILKLQTEIATALTRELKIKLTPAVEKRFSEKRTLDPQAVEAFLLGRHYFNKWTRESERLAVENFQKAVAIEPQYSDAWAGLSDAWTVRAMVGDITTKEAGGPTREAALKALEIDPDNSAAQISMCFVHNNYDFDWVRGESACERGIELDPNNAKGHFAYAYILSRLERHEEVAQQMETAMKLDPAEPWWPSVYAAFLVQARRFEMAEALFNRAIAIDPTYGPTYNGLRNLYIETGRFHEALKIYRERGGREDTVTAAYIYARMGDRKKAARILDQIPPDVASEDPYEMVLAYTALDEFDKAFDLINRTIENGEGFMFGYANFLVLDKLKSDLRWTAVRRRMNFPN